MQASGCVCKRSFVCMSLHLAHSSWPIHDSVSLHPLFPRIVCSPTQTFLVARPKDLSRLHICQKALGKWRHAIKAGNRFLCCRLIYTDSRFKTSTSCNPLTFGTTVPMKAGRPLSRRFCNEHELMWWPTDRWSNEQPIAALSRSSWSAKDPDTREYVINRRAPALYGEHDYCAPERCDGRDISVRALQP
jgi:hypothetical protein